MDDGEIIKQLLELVEQFVFANPILTRLFKGTPIRF